MPTKHKPALHIFSASIVLLLLVQASIAKDAPSPKDLAPKGSSGGKVTASGHWIPDGAVDLKGIKRGKYLHMGEGRLLCIAGNAASLSTDRGRTWKKLSTIIKDTKRYNLGVGRDILLTKKGTIIVPFSNGKEKKWGWTAKLHDAPEAVLPTYVVRSTDGGKTWLEPQKLHDDWTGDNSGIIQTDKGSILMASMKLLHNPGRHTVITYRSTDEGATWKPSHTLDLGGAGHHDGTKEAALLQQNGRPWMLIRTNWNFFWNAFSDDDGKTWRTLYASDIDCSSSPGFLRRLKDGRIALVWNRLRPQNDPDFKFVHWPETHEAPASWHRDELVFALSSDEGKTWTDPVVIARKPKGNICYPSIFEIEPGKLWVAAAGGLHIELNESDFISK